MEKRSHFFKNYNFIYFLFWAMMDLLFLRGLFFS